MKYLYFLPITLMTVLSCKAQIIPVEDFENYNQELQDDAYVKDVNNLLDKYVGSWLGTYDNKTYRFEVIKKTINSSISNMKFDKLLIRYKITDANGIDIANTLELPLDSPFILYGNYLASSGSYVLRYIGLQTNCGQNGDVFISVYQPNKMKLFLSVDGETLDCVTGSVPQVLPTDWIDLTKQ